MVTVEARREGGGWLCEVDVKQADQHTQHMVLVSPGDLQRWGAGDGQADVEDLVRRSFEFLLERESPGSILRRFDLAVIQRYFPEYDRLFKR